MTREEAMTECGLSPAPAGWTDLKTYIAIDADGALGDFVHQERYSTAEEAREGHARAVAEWSEVSP